MIEFPTMPSKRLGFDFPNLTTGLTCQEYVCLNLCFYWLGYVVDL